MLSSVSRSFFPWRIPHCTFPCRRDNVFNFDPIIHCRVDIKTDATSSATSPSVFIALPPDDHRQEVLAAHAHSTTKRALHEPVKTLLFFFFFFSFISLIADGPHHYHPACGHKGSSHLSPVHALHFFLLCCKFSTLTTRQPMVEFYLLTFPRFPLRKKEHKSYFGKNRTHDFRTSRCAAYLLDHSGDERLPLLDIL